MLILLRNTKKFLVRQEFKLYFAKINDTMQMLIKVGQSEIERSERNGSCPRNGSDWFFT